MGITMTGLQIIKKNVNLALSYLTMSNFLQVYSKFIDVNNEKIQFTLLCRNLKFFVIYAFSR